MKDIALAILCVGLLFYCVWNEKHSGEKDGCAGFLAVCAAVGVLLRCCS